MIVVANPQPIRAVMMDQQHQDANPRPIRAVMMNQPHEDAVANYLRTRVMIRTRWGLEIPEGSHYIAKKTLKESDVSSAQSRLMLPSCDKISQIWDDLERNMIVPVTNENTCVSVRVTVMDYRRQLHLMDLTKWPSVKKFVLNKGWVSLVRDNHLVEGDEVEIWYFRDDSFLLFVVDTGFHLREQEIIQED
ncbi:hypothetical protein ACH5RR_000079 [Cinchona calisaya]|uniref:TF-B3 domain-containing protein n=1 Tax=Cinchona calisaya TaxID=153742 RepID=A0ABD3B028_9GENT